MKTKIQQLQQSIYVGAYFVNRMGPGYIMNITENENGLFSVLMTCNIWGHGAQQKTIFFRFNEESQNFVQVRPE